MTQPVSDHNEKSSADTSGASDANVTLLRGNLKKIKQKIIDTSKLLELYERVKNDLDVAQRNLREQSSAVRNQQYQVDKLLMERDGLSKLVEEKDSKIKELEKNLETVTIRCESVKALNVQLDSELEENRKMSIRSANSKEKDRQEKEKYRKRSEELQKQLSITETKLVASQQELVHAKSTENSSDKYSSLLTALLPTLRPLAISNQLPYRWITEIEKTLGKKISSPPPEDMDFHTEMDPFTPSSYDSTSELTSECSDSSSEDSDSESEFTSECSDMDYLISATAKAPTNRKDLGDSEHSDDSLIVQESDSEIFLEPSLPRRLRNSSKAGTTISARKSKTTTSTRKSKRIVTPINNSSSKELKKSKQQEEILSDTDDILQFSPRTEENGFMEMQDTSIVESSVDTIEFRTSPISTIEIDDIDTIQPVDSSIVDEENEVEKDKIPSPVSDITSTDIPIIGNKRKRKNSTKSPPRKKRAIDCDSNPSPLIPQNDVIEIVSTEYSSSEEYPILPVQYNDTSMISCDDNPIEIIENNSIDENYYSTESNKITSYSMERLLASFEIYTHKLNTFSRWSFETEEAYTVRRISTYLSEAIKNRENKIYNQIQLFSTLYDLTQTDYKSSTILIISSIKSAYLSIHKDIALSNKYKKFDEKVICTNRNEEDTQLSEKEIKVNILNDLVWNLSLIIKDNFWQILFQSFAEDIISSNQNSLEYKQRALLCKRYIEFSKASGNIGAARTLVLHLVRNNSSSKMLYVAIIISIWPETLQIEDKTDSLLLKTIQFVILKQVDDNKQLVELICTKCNWVENNISLESIVDLCLDELSKLSKPFDESLFRISNSLLVLSRSQGWKWTYNQLICNKLGKFMVPTSSDEILIAVIHIWGLLCKSEILNSDTIPTCIEPLRARLHSLLLPQTPVSFKVQIAAVEALLEISCGYKGLYERIVTWYNSLSSTQILSISPMLNENIQLCK